MRRAIPVAPTSAPPTHSNAAAAQNKAKRLEEEATLAQWKAANPQAAARMEAQKAKAAKNFGHLFGSGRMASTTGGAGGSDEAEPARPSFDAPPPSKPKPAQPAEPTPELEVALAALRASSATPSAPSSRSEAPTDLLAAALGKAGACRGSAVGATPIQAGPRATPGAMKGTIASGLPSAVAGDSSVQDLLASALGKAGALPASPAKAPTGAARPAVSTGEEARQAARQASSAALGAYQKRQANDTQAPEGDVGTMGAELRRMHEVQQAGREEAKYRDKHAFVGEHYNDI